MNLARIFARGRLDSAQLSTPAAQASTRAVVAGTPHVTVVHTHAHVTTLARPLAYAAAHPAMEKYVCIRVCFLSNIFRVFWTVNFQHFTVKMPQNLNISDKEETSRGLSMGKSGSVINSPMVRNRWRSLLTWLRRTCRAWGRCMRAGTAAARTSAPCV